MAPSLKVNFLFAFDCKLFCFVNLLHCLNAAKIGQASFGQMSRGFIAGAAL
jgi:hypothetical protein